MTAGLAFLLSMLMFLLGFMISTVIGMFTFKRNVKDKQTLIVVENETMRRIVEEKYRTKNNNIEILVLDVGEIKSSQ